MALDELPLTPRMAQRAISRWRYRSIWSCSNPSAAVVGDDVGKRGARARYVCRKTYHYWRQALGALALTL